LIEKIKSAIGTSHILGIHIPKYWPRLRLFNSPGHLQQNPSIFYGLNKLSGDCAGTEKTPAGAVGLQV